MADTDPFVKRMLARSEARRAMLARLGGGGDGGKTAPAVVNSAPGKENRTVLETDAAAPCRHKNSSNASVTTVSQPSALGSHDTNLAVPPPSPPMPHTNTKTTTSAMTSSPSRPPLSSSVTPASHSSGTTRPTGRLNALARRQQEMQEWDDDYNYHFSSQGSKVSSSCVDHTNASVNADVSHTRTSQQSFATEVAVHVSTINNACDVTNAVTASTSPSKTWSTPGKTGSNSSKTTSTPTYIYGQSPSPSPEQNQAIELCLHRPKVVSTDIDAAAANAVNHNNKVLPTVTANHNRDMSPASKMFWDRKLINSLEAQGFTPTDSNTRLVYDFSKADDQEPEGIHQMRETNALNQPLRNNSPQRTSHQEQHNQEHAQQQFSSAESRTVNESPSKIFTHTTSRNRIGNQGDDAGAPRILSCVLKSSTTIKSSSPIRETQVSRGRNTSPNSVQQLRSRWEQQIRDNSPDRQQIRARSCSPNKQGRSESPTKHPTAAPLHRVLSPSKSYAMGVTTYQRDASPTKSYAGLPQRSVSPAKNVKAEAAYHRDLSPTQSNAYLPQQSVSPNKSSEAVGRNTGLSSALPVTAAGSTAPGSSNGVQQRGRDTRKAGQGPVVVKGVVPMPDTQPVLDQPFQCSVRAIAAAFTSVMSAEPAALPARDPAELSLQNRRQLFEKKGEDALLPKAPFGQPVPAKILSNSGGVPCVMTPSKTHSRPVHHLAPAHSAPVGTAVSRCHDALEAAASAAAARPATDDAWQLQKQRELQALHHRFPGAPSSHPPATPADDTGDSDSDDCYPESETSSLYSCEGKPSTAAAFALSPGPPKPPRVQAQSSPVPAPPPVQQVLQPQTAGSPRGGQQQQRGRSPSKSFEPRFKPGCVYPGLSDLESQSEVDCDDYDDSMCSVATYTSVDSLGTKIQRVAQANRTEQQPLHTLQEEDSLTNLLQGDTNGALDEAFSDDETSYDVTPPKRYRDEQVMDSIGGRGQYKTPRMSNSPGKNCTPSVSDSAAPSTPLAHTISMYRKQRPQEVLFTPVRIVRNDRAEQLSSSPAPAIESPSVSASAKIKHLNDMEKSELRIMSQASVAVSVAEQRPEQRGASHHVEAEKLLLLSTHRRLAIVSEVQRVKTEASMCVQNWAEAPDTSNGSLTISNISLPLSQDFLNKGIHGGPQHLVILVKQRENVIASAVQSSPSCVVAGAISVPNTIILEHLTPDFVVALEVYALKIITAAAAQGHLKKDPSRMKLTPLKRLQQHKNEGRSGSPACAVSSPGGPNAIRTSGFTLVGFTHLSIATLNRSAWTLDKVPLCSPLSGHLMMRVQCNMEGGVSERSFLTVFQDVGGLGAWTRRWGLLDGPTLRFWSYPDHENKKECLQTVSLKLVNTRRVELVSRDVCARPNTFLLTTVRPTQSGDKNSLVTDITSNNTVTKLLLSADSVEERVEWCRKLNIALANIRAWDPDATRPHDYNV